MLQSKKSLVTSYVSVTLDITATVLKKNFYMLVRR
jgi:hypothetical protein